MDLYAYALGNLDYVQAYLKKHYGDIPRFRGVRFMKIETAVPNESKSSQIDLYNSFCGQDVIYVHTRCGPYLGNWDDPDSNYRSFKADEWEKSMGANYLGHFNDEDDCTYCDHYFKAIPGDDYDECLKNIEEALKDED